MADDICIKCGKKIDLCDDPQLRGHCAECAENLGMDIECVICEYLDMEKSPPCSLEIIIIKNGECMDFTKSFSIDDLIYLIKNHIMNMNSSN